MAFSVLFAWRFSRFRQQLLDGLVVFLFVPLLKANLGVTNDAAGVDDIGRSAERVVLTHVGAVPVEDRIGRDRPACSPRGHTSLGWIEC
jgi:hypothetical protein